MSGVNFLQLLFVIGILVAIGIPLFKQLPSRKFYTPPDAKQEEYKHLLVRKEEILLSIKELEFDLKTDKVSEGDYQTIRAKLESEALSVLDQIEVLEKQLKKSDSRSIDAA